MKRAVIVLLMLLLMTSPIATMSFGTNDYVTITTEVLNLRSDNTTESSVIDTVSKGDTYELLEESINEQGELWYLIKVGDQTGFISADYATKSNGSQEILEDESTVQIEESKISLIRVTIDALRVRSSNNTSSDILGVITKGEEFSVLAESTNSEGELWYLINYQGKEGYLYSEYVEEVVENQSRISTTTTVSSVQTKSYATINTDTLRVRSSNNTWSTILGSVTRGTRHEILGESTNSVGELWYQINYLGQTGYISAEYTVKSTVTEEQPSDPDDKPITGAPQLEVTSDVAEIYVRPEGSRMGFVDKNTILLALGQSVDANGKTWYKVEHDQIEVYIKGEDVSQLYSSIVHTKTGKVAIVNTDILQVRLMNNTNSVVLGTVERNSRHDIIAESSNSAGELWYKIDYYGQNAYIYAAHTIVTDEEIEYKDITYALITANALRVRSHYSTTSTVLGTVANNTSHEVLGIYEDSTGTLWYKINFNGTEAYIYAGLTSATTESIEVKVVDTAIITANALRVRSTSDTTSSVLGTIANGTEVEILGESINSSGQLMYRINFNGKPGYIYAGLTTKSLMEVEYTTDSIAIITIDRLYVRARNTSNSPSLGTVAKGSHHIILSESRNAEGQLWHKINFNGSIGYIYAPFTSKSYAPKSPIKTEEIKTARITNDLLRVRASYTSNSQTIGTVAKDTLHIILDEHYNSNGDLWYEINFNGQTGYIYAGFTAISNDSKEVRTVGYATVTSNSLRVRSSYDSNSQIIGSVEKGSTHEILSESINSIGHIWYKIVYRNQIGYIYADMTAKTTKMLEANSIEIATITNDLLRVLDGLGSEANIIGAVAKDSRHEILDEILDLSGQPWYQINYNGEVGYIYAGFTMKSTKITGGLYQPIGMQKAPEKSAYQVNVVGGDFVQSNSNTITIDVSSKGFNKPQYKMSILKDGKYRTIRQWGTNPSYTTTLDSGTYRLYIQAREYESSDVNQVETVQHLIIGNNKVGLYSDSTGRNYFHSPIYFSAKSDVYGAQYRFSLSNGRILRDYSSSPYYKYTPTAEGEYKFIVTMRSPDGSSSSDSQTILIKKLESEINFQNLSGSTPNHYIGRNGWVPDMVVSHITEGSFSGSVGWLQNPYSQVSSNFVIGRDGRVVQLVDLRHGAWTNGTSNDPSSSVYNGKSKSQTVIDRQDNANYYTLTIENEGIYSQTRGAITSAQYRSNLAVLEYMKNEVFRIYGRNLIFNRDTFTGHDVITPGSRSTDPGELYPFDSLIRDINR